MYLITISKRQLQTNRTDVLNCSMAVCHYRSTECVATNVTPLSLLISAFETTLTTETLNHPILLILNIGRLQ